MANRLYSKYRQAALEGSIAILSDTIKASLVSASAYTPATTTDQFFSTIPSTVADSSGLSSKTSSTPNPGTFDAADITWSAVTGSQCDYVVVWKSTGTGSTSPLIALFDTGTNLPVTPNGGDITAQWSSGTDRIFTLFEGLPEAEAVTLWNLLKKWFKWPKSAGLELSPGGIWMPKLTLVQQPALLLP